jgi:hypothetical protein
VESPNLTDGRYVFFGAHSAKPAGVDMPKGSIIYNLEVISDEALKARPEYLDLLREYEVWDYSAVNVERLTAMGIEAKLLPIGYYPGLTRIPKTLPVVDVLFYGWVGARRYGILQQFARRGISVMTLYGEYGVKRDKSIARSKIVLNLHAYDESPLESVRISYLLANSACVLSESCKPEEEAEWVGVTFAGVEELASTCWRLLNSPEEREAMAKKGFETMKARDITEYLKKVLG